MKKMFDEQVNCLREDFKEDLHRTKLSMQMNFIVQLDRLRVFHHSFPLIHLFSSL